VKKTGTEGHCNAVDVAFKKMQTRLLTIATFDVDPHQSLCVRMQIDWNCNTAQSLTFINPSAINLTAFSDGDNLTKSSLLICDFNGDHVLKMT
jgi:hypothetical protein